MGSIKEQDLIHPHQCLRSFTTYLVVHVRGQDDRLNFVRSIKEQDLIHPRLCLRNSTTLVVLK